MSNITDLIFPGRITLVFPGEPLAKQSTRFKSEPTIDKKGHKHYSYQDKDVVAHGEGITWMAIQQLPKGFRPWDCGVIVVKALYVFPIPSSLKKAELQRIEAGGIVYKTTKPDLTDNISKGFFDALHNILFTNDSRVCHIKEMMKIYGYNPRAEFIFEPVKP